MSQQEKFIQKSREIYGDIYDYSEVVYKDAKTPVKIFCKIHKEYFYQKPCLHYHFYGCKKCSSEYKSHLRAKTTAQFIKEAKAIHGDKYDYSKTNYIDSYTKICIVCPEHGEFWQTPHNHLNGSGCNICANDSRSEKRNIGLGEFIDRAKRVHGNKYDYSKVEYIDSSTKVCIICPIHGEFWQIPTKHLNGQSCPMCYNDRRGDSLKISYEEVIRRAHEIHKWRYRYVRESFLSTQDKMDIICSKHGLFSQNVTSHLQGCGCPKCANENRNINNKLTTEEFIRRAKEIHGDRYDYSECEYIDWVTPVKIICHKTNGKTGKEHGAFFQKPSKHLKGQGCPKCKISKLEEEIENYLILNKLAYIYRAKKRDGLTWIGKQELDFYLPEHNIAIECQGIQHYEPRQIKGINIEQAILNFEKQLKLDENKKKLCEENGVRIFYYTNIKEKNDNICTFDDVKLLFNYIAKILENNEN